MIKIIFLILLLIVFTAFMIIGYVDGLLNNREISGALVFWIVLAITTLLSILRKLE